MNCKYKKTSGGCVCTVCGSAVYGNFPDCNVHRTCTGEKRSDVHVGKKQPNGLGDRIEHWLSSYGVTQEKYKEVKEKFGLPATCGCDGRKEWFNKVGAYFGIDPDRYGPNKETK